MRRSPLFVKAPWPSTFKWRSILAVGCIVFAGCASPPKDIGKLHKIINAELLNRHLCEKGTPANPSSLQVENGSVVMKFGLHCSIKIAKGGRLLPKQKFDQDRAARKNLLENFVEASQTEKGFRRIPSRRT